MNIAFDIDDVLTDPLYKNFNTNFVEAYFAKTGKRFNLLNDKETFFGKMYDWSKEEIEIFWNMEGENYLRNVPVREGAKELLEALKKVGHNNYAITQRFALKQYEISFDWLTRNGLVFDELIVNAKDKIDVCKDKKIDIIIDDRVSTCNKLIENGVRACVMNIPTNLTEETTAPRVDTFMQYATVIGKLDAQIKKDKELTQN